MALIGVYPTPVQRLDAFSSARTALWVKRDDLTNPVYGGNKVRKVERLLDDAGRRGAQKIVTVGAVGSNHVLTTGIFARERGMEVAAVVVSQPRTEHVMNNLRADLAQGIELIPASSYAIAALKIASRMAGGAYYIPAGGSNPIGAAGFVAAGHELAAQVRAGEVPEPDLIVVALGSGGTTAGLLAGIVESGLRTRVLAVTVAEPPWYVESHARSLASKCSHRASRAELAKRLEYERGYLGPGYGHGTERGERATELAAREGLTLDQTYTAKAFAAALDRVAREQEQTILYWHTLSSAPLPPLLERAPDGDAVAPELLRLARA